MSETATIDPSAAPVEKRRITLKYAHALLEVIERKKFTEQVDYKAIAKRHGARCGTLRNIYSEWRRGEVEIPQVSTPAERKIDDEMQKLKTIGMLQRYQAMLLESFEANIFMAEDEMTQGNSVAWKERGLPEIVRHLKDISALRLTTEKDYGKALADMQAAQERMEKAIPAGGKVDLTLRVLAADEHQRALAALAADVEESVEKFSEQPTPEGNGDAEIHHDADERISA